MTEFELVEAISMTRSDAGLAAMNCVAVLIAYVIAAHVAGKRLPVTVAFFTSLVYSLFLLGPGTTNVTNVIRMVKLIARYNDNFPNSDLYPLSLNAGVVAVIAAAPLIVGWIGSLYYMHGHVRSRKAVR